MSNEGLVEFNWLIKKNSWCNALLNSIDCAIGQAQNHLTGHKNEADAAVAARLRVLQLLRVCAVEIRRLNTADAVKSSANSVNQLLTTSKELWVGTTFLDRPLFWINKIVNLFVPQKSVSLFQSPYVAVKKVEEAFNAGRRQRLLP